MLTLQRTFWAVLFRRLVRGPLHPGWNFRYEFTVMLLRRLSDRVHHRPLEELRTFALSTRIPAHMRDRIDHHSTTYCGMLAEVHTPRGHPEGGRTLLYFHGGGYILCSPATHRELIGRLAHATSARCIAVDYRKAPEHPFPAGIDDCEMAYRALLADGIPPEQIILAGDSAGGGLVLSVLLRARDAGLPLPAFAILFSPWCDLTRSGASIQTNAAYDYLTPSQLAFGVAQYLQGHDPEHPLASHVRADLRGLPPLLMFTGEAELFLSENLELAARAQAAGVEVTHHVSPASVHVFGLLAAISPAAAALFRHVSDFVQQRQKVTAVQSMSDSAKQTA
jgi:monoterpene epsilon-lactone hydrolase